MRETNLKDSSGLFSLSRNDFKISGVAKTYAEKVEILKKERPDLALVLENPKSEVAKLVKANKFKAILEISDFISNKEFSSVILNELSTPPLSQEKLRAVSDLIELSSRDFLEKLPKAFFANPDVLKLKGFSNVLKTYLTFIEEDAQDDFVDYFLSKNHAAQVPKIKKRIFELLKMADEETLPLIRNVLQKEHFSNTKFNHLREASQIEDINARKLFIANLHKSKKIKKTVVKSTSLEEQLDNKTPKMKMELPKLETDKERLRWILTVKKRIPELFSQSANYDIDLLKLLEEQSNLQKKLLENPKYLKLLREEHPDLLKLTVSTLSDGVVHETRIDPKSIKKWKSELDEILIQFKKSEDLSKSLLNEIVKTHEKIAGRSFQGLLTGLTLSLSKEMQKEIFQAENIDEKLKLLSELISSPLPESFQANRFGFTHTPSKEEVFTLAKELQQNELTLNNLIKLHVVLQEDGGVITKEYEHALNKIANFEGSNLENFTDKDAVMPRLTQLNSALKASKQKIVNPKVNFNSIQSDFKKYIVQIESTQKIKDYSITLREVQPAVGIFRGCTGGDCSTQYSFPYPNAPKERTFFIYDQEGKLKGYMTGSTVLADGKKSFYPITIAGPHLSSNDTQMIFEGLNRSVKKLGVEQIVLPSDPSSLINFTPIRNVYQKSINGSEKKNVAIEYLDKDSRSVIEQATSTYNHGSYDKMSNNKTGAIYKGLGQKEIALDIQVEHANVKEDLVKLSKDEILTLAFQLHLSGRKAQITKVLDVGEVSTEQFKEVLDIYENTNNLPIKEYKKQLLKFGITSQHIDTNYEKFLPKLTKAPDFLLEVSEKNLFKYFDEILEILPNKNLIIENGKELHLFEILKKKAKITSANELSLLLHLAKNYSSLITEKDIEQILITIPEYEKYNFIFSINTMTNKSLRPLINEIINKWTEQLNKLIEKGDEYVLSDLARYTFSQPHSTQWKEQLNNLIEKGDQYVLFRLAEYTFSKPHSVQWTEQLNKLIEKGDQNVLWTLASQRFSKPHSVKWTEQLNKLIEKGDQDVLWTLASQTFSKHHSVKWAEQLNKLIEKGEKIVLSDLAEHTFSQPHSVKWTEQLNKLIEKGDQDVLVNLARYTFTKPHSVKWTEQLNKLIEKGDQDVLVNLARYTFTKPHSTQWKEQLNKLIEKGYQNILRSHAAHTFSQPHFDKFENTQKILELYLSKINKSLKLKPDNELEKIKIKVEQKILKLKEMAIKNNIDIKKAFAGKKYNEGDIVKTKKSNSYRVIKFIDSGRRGNVYLATDQNTNKKVVLKVAKDSSKETLDSFAKEELKNKQYVEHGLAHASISEAYSDLIVKEYIEGIRGDEFIKDWELRGSPRDDPKLVKLLALGKDMASKKVYFGDLNSKNLIWSIDKNDWVVIDSGTVQIKETEGQALEKFIDSVNRKWGKKINNADTLMRCMLGTF